MARPNLHPKLYHIQTPSKHHCTHPRRRLRYILTLSGSSYKSSIHTSLVVYIFNSIFTIRGRCRSVVTRPGSRCTQAHPRNETFHRACEFTSLACSSHFPYSDLSVNSSGLLRCHLFTRQLCRSGEALVNLAVSLPLRGWPPSSFLRTRIVDGCLLEDYTTPFCWANEGGSSRGSLPPCV